MTSIKEKKVETLDTQHTIPAPKIQMLAYNSELINKMGDYLSTKPWREVNELLAELQKGVVVEV